MTNLIQNDDWTDDLECWHYSPDMAETPAVGYGRLSWWADEVGAYGMKVAGGVFAPAGTCEFFPAAGQSVTLTADFTGGENTEIENHARIQVGYATEPVPADVLAELVVGHGESVSVNLSGIVPAGYDGTRPVVAAFTGGHEYGQAGPSLGPGAELAALAPADPVVIDDPGQLDAAAGQLFGYQLTSTPAGTWALLDGPEWLTVDADGFMYGTPALGGVFTATVTSSADGETSALLVTVTVAEPVLSADADPWADIIPADILDRLVTKVAGFTGHDGDAEMIALARLQIPAVYQYVQGFTRGRGFTDAGVPVPALQVVIVSAGARLLVNPEQVRQYTAGDYSETPAVLAGWTLPERAVLHGYRRRFA